MSRDALIVGAGIGGLAAALALRQAGWRVRVLERASNPRELGFALVLAPNAMYALRQLGVADVVAAGGSVATSGAMRRPNGDVLRRFDLDRVRDLLPEPTVTVLRPVLHGALLDAVGDAALALDSEVVRFNARAEGVEVQLVDGRTTSARVLVGADGAGSAVRRELHPGEPPARRSGLFGLRGVAHDVARRPGEVGGAQYFGRGIEAGLARAGGATVYWYMSLPRALVTAGSMDPPAVLRRAAAGFHDDFQRIVFATRPEDMRLDELLDRDPVESWGRGPVTLLGDAAHPMLPHAGQGAAQAIEDAVALGRALETAADAEAGLRAYERVRAARTRAVVLLARRNARLGSLANPLAAWMRDTLIRTMPARLILRQIVALGRPPEVDSAASDRPVTSRAAPRT